VKELSLITTAILIISVLASCASNKETGNINNLPEVVYAYETIQFPPLPDGMENINNVVLADNTVYFSAWGEVHENTLINPNNLFSMDIDGTNLEALPNYVPGAFPENVKTGTVIISALHVDGDGNIWVAEYRGSPESDHPENYIGSILRKLDKSGAEISSFDLNILSARNNLVYINALSVDDAGHIYIASLQGIHIFDNKKNLLFELDRNEYLANFVVLSDGTVAYITLRGGNIYLNKIDTERNSWGEVIRLPSNVSQTHSVFSGTEDYNYLFNDNVHLNGVIEETNESVKLLNWEESVLAADDITGIMLMSDGRIAATRQKLHGVTGSMVIELLLLTETVIEDIPDKTELTFATFNYHPFMRAGVEQFNRKSKTHNIIVKDYSLFNTDENSDAGLLRLNTEIITGNAPDIIELGSLPRRTFISKGLLVDLYPFLDADPVLSRDCLLESIIKLSETNGSLYQIFPGFGVGTMLGNPSVLGDYPGWTLDEFIEVLDANPQADFPLGPHFTKMSFLSTAFRYSIDRFIDPVTNTALFDSNDFIGMLEIANRFTEEISQNNFEPRHKLIVDKRQIIEIMNFMQFENYPVLRAMFDGEIVFKGFPNENRTGNILMPYPILAISAFCDEPDAAWEFIRIFLTEEYQRNTLNILFPTNKTVFEEKLEFTMKNSGGTVSTGDGFVTHNTGFSQEEADEFIDLINNLNRIMDYDPTIWMIISESAGDYFSGQITAEDAARIIQNRVSIYLSEQAE